MSIKIPFSGSSHLTFHKKAIIVFPGSPNFYLKISARVHRDKSCFIRAVHALVFIPCFGFTLFVK